MRKPATPRVTETAPERIQKVLAAAGLGSRREIENWISAGRVSVDGRVAKLGERVAAGQRISVDGKPVRALERGAQADRRILLYHKPQGELTTRKDPDGRPTVYEALPLLRGGRWISIGGMETNASGLLLFTNDGALADKLMRPAAPVECEYAVRILGEVTQDQLESLKRGLPLESGRAHFDAVEETGGEGANRWYSVLVRDAGGKEVRALWEAVGMEVSRLIRVRYGNIVLPRNLPRGTWRDTTEEETHALLVDAGMPLPQPRPTLTLSKPKSAKRRH